MELERLEEQGVISRVEERTDWCPPMIIVPKSNGRVRICIDLTKLNDSVRREKHILPSVEQILAKLRRAKCFRKLDANSAVHQIPFIKESAHLTTFVTTSGQFCYNHLPFGITSAPEHFQWRMSDITWLVLHDLQGTRCIIDDNNLWSRPRRVWCTTRCSIGKYQVSRSHPTDQSELRRFLGMANQLGKFSRHVAEISKLLQVLLSLKREWIWDSAQKQYFRALKQELSKPDKLLAHYDPTAQTVVSADASSLG